jgi:hypothetical protein
MRALYLLQNSNIFIKEVFEFLFSKKRMLFKKLYFCCKNQEKE